MKREKLAECEEMIMSVLWSSDEDMTMDEVTERLTGASIRTGRFRQ